MCQSYDYLGSRSDGGFAEYVSVPVWNLIELPDRVSFETAAMLEPTAVAAHAMRRIVEGGSSPGSDSPVAVCGLGTIGLLLIMLLKQRGFSNVYAIGKRAAQQQRAAKLGVDGQHYLDATDPDTPGKLRALGIEAFWECVGSRDTYVMAIDVTAPLGQVMLVGNPHSDMDLDRDVYWKILRNQLTVYGTWNSSYGTEKDDWKYVLGLMERGVTDPEVFISHRLPLEGLMEGLVIMRDKTEDYGKVMVSF
jgi:L-iditol 2-dehydrogenase